MKKKSFVVGALILGLASVACKVLGAVFRIPLTYLIGTKGVGIYQLVFPIYALFLTISSSGIPVSLSKIISKENSKGNYLNTKIIFKNAVKLMLILGLIFSVLIVIMAYPIASIQSNTNMFILYIFIAPGLFFSTILSSFRGYFQGFEVFTYSAVSQVIEQLFKLVFGLLFAYFLLPYGIIYGVLGAIIGIDICEFLTFLYLFICYKKRKIKVDFTQNSAEIYTNKESIKLIIKEALPITLSSIILPLTSVVDSLIIIKLLSNVGFSFSLSTTLYGLDSGVVSSLINLPTVVAFSLGISLMPAISSSFAKNNTKEVTFKTKLALKLVWYLTLPCVLIFFMYSTEICSFLYGNFNNVLFDQLKVASVMIKFSSFTIIYVAINQIVTTSLQAINKSYLPVFVILFSSILKIVLTVVLVLNKSLNIYGLVLSDVITTSLACIINFAILKKYVKISFSFKEIFVVPFVSLFFMSVILVLFKFILFTNLSKLLILVSLFVSFIVYLLFVLVLKGFNLKEISNTKILKFLKKKKY